MKKLLFTLLSAMALIGCSDDDTDKYPITLSYDKIEPRSEMKVFTDGGKPVTSEKAVSDFLAKEYITIAPGSIIWYNSAFRELDDSYGKNTQFDFLEDNRILYTVEITNVGKEGDAIILKSTIDNRLEENSIVTSGLYKYKLETDDYGNYYYQYVAHGDLHKALDVSVLYYKLVRHNEKGERTTLQFGTVHNEFNEAFTSTLGARDTLAVKQYALKYSRK